MDTLEKLRKENRSALSQALEKITRYAEDHAEIIKVVLFGSAARERWDALTDLDILVVMDTDEEFFSRGRDILACIDVPVDIDLLCYRPDEMDALSERPLFRQIKREGKVLYEKQPVRRG